MNRQPSTSWARTAGLALVLIAGAACSTADPALPSTDTGDEPRDGGVLDQGVPPRDVGPADTLVPDAGFLEDMGVDSGRPDTGVLDIGVPDTGVPTDTGVAPDTGPFSLRVLTFNTGTSGSSTHNSPPDDGYTSTEADITDQYYGNGLSWVPVMDDTRDFFSTLGADIVVFQEIFYTGECAMMPAAGVQPGFICDGWTAGQDTVANSVLGPDWQVACNLGKSDKCAAVNINVGTFQGCAQSLCLDGLAGARVMDCGGGSRIGRGVIDLVGGGTITVVNVHGSSGILSDDQDCREQQFEQVFVDLGLGDGTPGANGTRNLVMGDFNTDPVRNTLLDSSARRLGDFVGSGQPFKFISDVGRNADPTYAGLFNIDHVISDHFVGSCFAPGVTQGQPAVSDIEYFDHVPIVCDITEP